MQTEIPLVSISCITFNHASFIKQALDGFLSQKTTFPFEILIHDDCSTDGTSDIIRDYASKYPDLIFPMFEDVNQYRQGKPIGTVVWNLPRARGKYIALCEGDDYWSDPLKLQKQVDFLEAHPDYGMCYTKVERLSQSTGKIINIWGGANVTFEELLLKNTVPTLTTVFKTELYREFSRCINPSSKGWKMGDYPLWLYISQKAKIHFSPEVTAVYRVLGESASHSKSISKRYYFDKNYKEIAEFFLNLNIDKVSTEVKDKFYISKHSLLLTMANIVRDNEELVQAKEFLQTRVKTLRLRILTLPNWLIRFPLMLKFRLEGWTL